MKKIFTTLFCLFLLMSPAMPIHASSDAYVIDTQGLLTQEEVQALNQKAAEAVNRYNTGIYVRFYANYDTEDIESYAEEVYTQEDLGIGPDKDGVLLIVTMNDRSYDIAAYGDNANMAFTDYGKEELANTFLSYLSDGQYYEAADAFITNAENYLYQAENAEPVDTWVPETNETYEMSAGTKTAIVIGIPCIVSLILCFLIAHRNKTSHIQKKADQYITENGFRLTGMQDVYLYQTRSVTHIPRNNSGGSPGGTSVNSSGFSHSSGHF